LAFLGHENKVSEPKKEKKGGMEKTTRLRIGALLTAALVLASAVSALADVSSPAQRVAAIQNTLNNTTTKEAATYDAILPTTANVAEPTRSSSVDEAASWNTTVSLTPVATTTANPVLVAVTENSTANASTQANNTATAHYVLFTEGGGPFICHSAAAVNTKTCMAIWEVQGDAIVYMTAISAGATTSTA
jgi:hypothetical protein